MIAPKHGSRGVLRSSALTGATLRFARPEIARKIGESVVRRNAAGVMRIPCKSAELEHQASTTEHRGVAGSSSGPHGSGPYSWESAKTGARSVTRSRGPSPSSLFALPTRPGLDQSLHRSANHPRLPAADGALSFAARDAPRGKTLRNLANCRDLSAAPDRTQILRVTDRGDVPGGGTGPLGRWSDSPQNRVQWRCRPATSEVGLSHSCLGFAAPKLPARGYGGAAFGE